MKTHTNLKIWLGVIIILLAILPDSVFGIGGDMGLSTEPLTDDSQDYPWLIEDLADFQPFCEDSALGDDYTRLDCDLNLSAAGTYTQARPSRGSFNYSANRQT